MDMNGAGPGRPGVRFVKKCLSKFIKTPFHIELSGGYIIWFSKKAIPGFSKNPSKLVWSYKNEQRGLSNKKQYEMSIYRNHLSKYHCKNKISLTFEVCELIAISQCREFNFEKLNCWKPKLLEKSSDEILSNYL